MASEKPQRDAALLALEGPLEGEAVKAFLKENPDFLAKNDELFQVLTPPGLQNGASNLHDMQQFMLRRLQDEVTQLNQRQSELLTASRGNMSVQGQVHNATLMLLEATSFEHLIHLVTTDLAQTLDVDVVTICVEATNDAPTGRAKTAGVYVLDAGSVDARLGEGRDVMLTNETEADPTVFGPGAGLVRSQALARLRASSRAPAGILALGSREEEKFHPGQATELLGYLARVLERLIRGWLKLPA